MDTLSNLITSIRNAEMAGLNRLSVPFSQISEAVLKVLAEFNYIHGFESTEKDIRVDLGVAPVRHHYKRISKPGRRLYTDAKSIPLVLGGKGLVILSSSLGVISGKEAKERQVGGEIICEVY